MKEENKRRFTRIQLDIAVQFRLCGEEDKESLQAANTVNISPGGFCLKTGRVLEADHLVQVNLPWLGGGFEEVFARVVHNQPQPSLTPGAASGVTGYFSGLAVLPQYQEKLSDFIENLDTGCDLGLYLSGDDREFLESLAGGKEEVPACIIGISRFFQGLGLKGARAITSEEDLITHLTNQLKKRD